MKKALFNILLCACLLASVLGCKHDVPGKSYKVGDIIFEDGSQEAWTEETKDSILAKKDKIVAIIAKSSAKKSKALGIGIDSVENTQITVEDSSLFTNKKTVVISSLSYESDQTGLDNYKELCKYFSENYKSDIDDLNNYPAFKVAKDKGPEWFIPDFADLEAVIVNKTKDENGSDITIGKALSSLNSNFSQGNFWTSTVSDTDPKLAYTTKIQSGELINTSAADKSVATGMGKFVLLARLYTEDSSVADGTYTGSKKPGTYAVGDVVYSDGSSDTYADYKKNNKKGSVAIIAMKYGKAWYAISTTMTTTRYKWCLDTADGYQKVITGLTDKNHLYHNNPEYGFKFGDELKMIDLFVNDTPLIDKYPAFAVAKSYKVNAENALDELQNNWYVPSYLEAAAIGEEDYNTVKDIYFEINGSNLPDSIMTSSLYYSKVGASNTECNLKEIRSIGRSFNTLGDTFLIHQF